jgi:sialate O-acetylesterase
VYGQKISYSGPLFSSHQIKDASMVCSFTHGEGGLMAREGGELTGFVIAGADRQWHSADARIEGEMVWVSSREVPNPVAVRYGWAPDPKCNLVNGAGLPASPFRTDDWPSALHAPNLRSK